MCVVGIRRNSMSVRVSRSHLYRLLSAPRHLEPRFVLLSAACPTSLAGDQTKGGGRPGVQRTPRSGAREQRFDLTKIQLSSKLSPKDPKEFAKKNRELRGAAPGKGRPTNHNTKGNSTETSHLFAHTERSVADALRLKFFFH